MSDCSLSALYAQEQDMFCLRILFISGISQCSILQVWMIGKERHLRRHVHWSGAHPCTLALLPLRRAQSLVPSSPLVDCPLWPSVPFCCPFSDSLTCSLPDHVRPLSHVSPSPASPSASCSPSCLLFCTWGGLFLDALLVDR
ncbi:unnamed protein product [Pleuronectes platessa]|uniref:Uncharacterized protein n=1 Tax=Pleuronectes platessa TaxID=8262 RepID=A0A9N7YWJ0_PLEPL|nr:unnamed protein product [Pleuronectes platessa]